MDAYYGDNGYRLGIMGTDVKKNFTGIFSPRANSTGASRKLMGRRLKKNESDKKRITKLPRKFHN
jgi:hypothetical protein